MTHFIDWYSRDPDGAVPGDFGDPAAESAATRQGAALFVRHDRGRLLLSGGDALDLLHRTTTGDLAGLAPGRAATTVVQSETGRIHDWLTAWRRPDDLLLLGGPGRGVETAAWLDRMIIMDDARVTDLARETGLLELAGPGVPDALAKALGDNIPLPGAEAGPGGPADGGALFIGRAPGWQEGAGSWWLLAPPSLLATVARRLVEAGVVPAGRIADESFRLERGMPLVGRELTAVVNPLEARLHESIGFRKGCYPGQEVIARMITYKSVKRTLSVLEPARPVAAPPAGESYPLVDGGPTAGRVTSVARSALSGRTIALGYLKNELAAPGTSVTFETPDGALEARVLTFPTGGVDPWN